MLGLLLGLMTATSRQTIQTQLHGLFTDNMVLQRDKPLPIWGTAAPGQAVAVSLAGQSAKTVATPRGNWMVTLKPIHGPGPYDLTVQAETTQTLHNVAVGEVWIASGQSNMEFATANTMNAADELKAANYPDIRLYHVAKRTVESPLHDVESKWQPVTPANVAYFSAVGYFFARTLYTKMHVPIGMIESDWGGTPAESWTTRQGLLGDPSLRHIEENYEATLPKLTDAIAKYQQDLAAYNARTFLADSGNEGVTKGWADPAFDDSTWADVKVPNYWSQGLGFNFIGGGWERTTVDIPAALAGKDATLELGAIDDTDTTYFNGKQVGATGSETPASWQAIRHYKVPGDLIKAGKNTIAVRVWNSSGEGGIYGGEHLQLLFSSGESFPLEGTWRFATEKGFKPDPNMQPPVMPLGPGNPWVPTSLYNGMIACLPPFAIRGAIWYQGESNADRAYQYRRLFPVMIQSWRDEFGQGNFPFYFVQLANFTARNTVPVESDWAELREAQAMTLSLPHTGMATAIDVGAADTIHPLNKQEVGRRLALIALAKDYHEGGEYSGPMFKRMSVEGSTVRLSFDHTTGGLMAHGDLAGFSVAGADHKFYWATAKIDHGQVVLTCAEVTKPVAVRYGWAINPPITLYNGAGLPAPPFRTDSWPGVTINRG